LGKICQNFLPPKYYLARYVWMLSCYMMLSLPASLCVYTHISMFVCCFNCVYVMSLGHSIKFTIKVNITEYDCANVIVRKICVHVNSINVSTFVYLLSWYFIPYSTKLWQGKLWWIWWIEFHLPIFWPTKFISIFCKLSASG